MRGATVVNNGSMGVVTLGFGGTCLRVCVIVVGFRGEDCDSFLVCDGGVVTVVTLVVYQIFWRLGI